MIEPNPQPPRVIAVTSGKGGVGKTTVSINLAIELARVGRKVTLLDADLGLANVDVMLGLSPRQTLGDVLDGRCELPDCIIEGPGGIRVIPAASGVQKMAELSSAERAGLLYAFSHLRPEADVMVVDTAAGIATNTLQFCDAAQEVLIVVCNDPASITDAYATIKVLSRRTRRSRFRVVVNMVEDSGEALDLFKNLLSATDRFLDVSLDLIGSIPVDKCVQTALRRRTPLVEAYPGSPAARAFKDLAQTADNWPKAQQASGGLEFFVERMVQADMAGRRVPV
jgi:flagellar biosynthesis protein FlhG